MNCILLVRVSTEKQSYDAQMKELHETALKAGYAEKDIVPVAEKESGIKLSEEESWWEDKEFVKENAVESGFIEVDGKHYCPNCYTIDDEDNIVVKK